MMNHATTEVWFDDVPVQAENLIGVEGQGFRYILSGMNAERILIAAECIGDAKWFLDKASGFLRQSPPLSLGWLARKISRGRSSCPESRRGSAGNPCSIGSSG